MIQVVQRTLNVLECLARGGEKPAALGEIAQATGLNPATCSRILKTLVSRDYAEQGGRRQGYQLGPMSYALAARGAYRKDLVASAEPFVRRLAHTTGETAIVAIVHQNTRYTICQAEGGQDVQVRDGAVLCDEVYPYATGRLLLAHMPAADLDAFVAHSGLPDAEIWPRAHTRHGLLTELASLRTSATVVTTKGQIVGLARPVSRAGRVVAALGLYLPASRFTGARREEIIQALAAAADAITASLTVLQARLEPREQDTRHQTPKEHTR